MNIKILKVYDGQRTTDSDGPGDNNIIELPRIYFYLFVLLISDHELPQNLINCPEKCD